MSILHSQLALFGKIDELVMNATKPETVAIVEKLLPGTTGIGQQGWYGELRQFLSRPELARDADGNPRSGELEFPDYVQAVGELTAPTISGEGGLSPAAKAKSLFAATILSKVAESEGISLPPTGPTEEVTDPLEAVLPSVTREFSGQIPGIESPEALILAFRQLNSREEYQQFTKELVEFGALDPEVGLQNPVCTGSLGKIGGEFCTILGTSWDTPYTLAQLSRVVDPRNWPNLCDFFVGMELRQTQANDRRRGWTRVLEVVSGDKTQWNMRTSLRYWKGETPDGGIYINYDLDVPRENDDPLVQIDAGYIWVTPIPNDPDDRVRLRTRKQVRIKGLSPTATGALGCVMGWSDAMTQMFGEQVTDAVANRVPFPPLSTDPGPDQGNSQSQTALQSPDAQILAAAEEVELPVKWRAAMVENVRKQLIGSPDPTTGAGTGGIDLASSLAKDFLTRWMDGMDVNDVHQFGERVGRDVTKYATDMFKGAAATVRPPSDKTPTGGNV